MGMTNEQIQEARQFCDDLSERGPCLYDVDELSERLLPALDEIERLCGAIEEIWNMLSGNIMCPCTEDCREIDRVCGSPECKKAFMEHYLGGEKVGS